ncbi:MAG: LON peptidase substrate-binding domain-containing protein, partial [Ilumatobacteraceae bacterium]
MTDSSTASSGPPTTSTASTVRLPLADLPATVLPGAVITLALVTDQLRRAVEDRTTAGNDRRILLRAGDDQLAVVAQVPDIGALPTGEPVAIVRVEARARIVAVHASERGATYADAEILRDPRPTPRVEAMARELRVVLESIAELRRSRRLPDLLRSAPEPGALADGVVNWADLEELQRREVLASVDVA